MKKRVNMKNLTHISDNVMLTKISLLVLLEFSLCMLVWSGSGSASYSESGLVLLLALGLVLRFWF